MRCNAYLKIKNKKFKKKKPKKNKEKTVINDLLAYTEIYYSYVRCLCVCVFFLYIYILNVYSLILFSKKKITT